MVARRGRDVAAAGVAGGAAADAAAGAGWPSASDTLLLYVSARRSLKMRLGPQRFEVLGQLLYLFVHFWI